MTPFAGLDGTKVTLRSFGPDDITESYLGWLGDPVTTRYSNQRFRKHGRNSCEAYLSSFALSDNLFVVVRDAANSKPIGTMTAYRNRHHGTCDVGIMIGERDYWGGGYGQEAWNLLTDWLLAEGGVRKLTAGCLGINGGMVTLMERSGMHREGVRKRQEIVNGKTEDVLFYARFAD